MSMCGLETTYLRITWSFTLPILISECGESALKQAFQMILHIEV